MRPIYLDNQATTPIDPKVLLAMQPWLNNYFGNSASMNHIYGWEASEAVEKARDHVAKIICSNSREIVFTSGATESNNIALIGAARFYRKKGNHIITLNTEHKAVLDVLAYLSKEGFQITQVPVKKNGIIDLEKFANSINEKTILVSIMHANNEIGVIQPIKQLGTICKNNDIIFHVDAAQSTGKIPIDVNEMNIDLLSISGHKFYAPKGVGALFIRKQNPKIELEPIIYGGGHERNIRPGTMAVQNIVGLGAACNIAKKNMHVENKIIKNLRDKLLVSIQNQFNSTFLNGCNINRLSGNLNLGFKNLNSESIISSSPEIAISTGSACTSTSKSPSHVLLSLGLSKNQALSSIRISIGRFNTEEEIDQAGYVLCNSIKKLQNIKSIFTN